MSKRRELQERRRRLGEVRDILHAMKTLAFLESRRLARLVENQHKAAAEVAALGRDFLGAWPELAAPPPAERHLALLVGSERGFCGDFNHAVRAAHAAAAPGQPQELVVVGQRLAHLYEGRMRLRLALPGPTVAEEVPRVLDGLVAALADLQAGCGGYTLTAWVHRDEHAVEPVPILPPFAPLSSVRAEAPLLYLPADEFYARLVDHHLLQSLQGLLYGSLHAENTRRAQHLDAAIRRLDDRNAELERRANAARQEEIVEEIEVLLLSARQRKTTGNTLG